MAEPQRFTQEQMQPLPRWARLAFAARCVRRAATLLRGPAEQARVIDRAIALVEEASRLGQAAVALGPEKLYYAIADGSASAPAGRPF